MSKQLVSIIDVPKHVGEEITIGAWVAANLEKGNWPFFSCVMNCFLPSCRFQT